MSQRVHLQQTPLSNPELFIKIATSDVQVGDIFQGMKNPGKWYSNTTGQACVDSFRQYYRPKSAVAEGAAEAPCGGRVVGVAGTQSGQQIQSIEKVGEDYFVTVRVKISAGAMMDVVSESMSG